MAYDIKTGDTIIISANLSASPVTGENAAVELGKVVLGTLYGNAIVPKGDAAAAPQSPASSPARPADPRRGLKPGVRGKVICGYGAGGPWIGRRSRGGCLGGAGAPAALGLPAAAGAAPCSGGRSANLQADRHLDRVGYAPTFTGNGLLGVRVPPRPGLRRGTVPAQSELAGFYAQPKGEVQQRSNIPTWSTLTFADGGKAFDAERAGDPALAADGSTCGPASITTRATWKAPDGHITDLALRSPHRPRPPARRAGAAADDPALVGDRDGRRPLRRQARELNVEDKTRRSSPKRSHEGLGSRQAGYWETVRAVGTGVEATLADRPVASANVAATTTALDAEAADEHRPAGRIPGRRRADLQLTKYVGVDDTDEGGEHAGGAPAKPRRRPPRSATARCSPRTPPPGRSCGAGRIEVPATRPSRRDVNASQFYLWSSTREGVDWSISPAGLSSNGYNGHIFWDAETWMFPSLLAQHPELAAGMNDYRFQRLAEAAGARERDRLQGARFPWESALDGTEQIPPPAPTQQRGPLRAAHRRRRRAGPVAVLRGDRGPGMAANEGLAGDLRAAEFWASPGAGGRRAASTSPTSPGPTRRTPTSTTRPTRTSPRRRCSRTPRAPPRSSARRPRPWSKIAAGLVVPFDTARGIHPEFAGYKGQLVKQADVTLIQYPWAFPMSKSKSPTPTSTTTCRAAIPGGPSMTDAV